MIQELAEYYIPTICLVSGVVYYSGYNVSWSTV